MVIFMNTGDTNSLFIFIFVGILTSFFNKNMIIILCIALIITNIVKYGIKGMTEGFEGGDDKPKKNDKKTPTTATTAKKDQKDQKAKKAKTDNKATVEELKEEYTDFTDIQTKITNGMKEMEPLLDKAESFIDKYQHLLP